jgi:hypothetical protein
MAGIQGTNVVAPIVPLDTADVHPTHEALYGKGGYRTVATTVERDAIPAARREAGMLVHVVADSTAYRLSADLTTWTVFNTGGGSSAWADITGKPSTFAPSTHAATHGSGGADPITVAQSQVTGLTTDLAGKAATNAPTFSGEVVFADGGSAVTATINGGSIKADALWFIDDGPFSRQRSPYTNTEKDKLAGIATGATANATDAQLRDRSTHTGTQAAGTITGLAASATTDTTSATNITTGTLPAARLPATTVTASAYGSASSVATFTVGADGRLTAAGSTAIAIAAGAVSGLGGAATLNVGTSAGTVAAGNDARLSDSRAPSGAAGGDLTGTYPNPTIAAGAVVTADLADGAVTLVKTTGVQKAITSGTAAPTGGSNGDIYLQYPA